MKFMQTMLFGLKCICNYFAYNVYRIASTAISELLVRSFFYCSAFKIYKKKEESNRGSKVPRPTLNVCLYYDTLHYKLCYEYSLAIYSIWLNICDLVILPFSFCGSLSFGLSFPIFFYSSMVNTIKLKKFSSVSKSYPTKLSLFIYR